MPSIENKTKEKLAAGELALGVGLRNARTVDIAKAMRTAGYDWLFIDMEHSAIDLDTATQISVAAQDCGITPIVRVPGFEHHHATRVLDCGAQGIVVPHVDDAQTAERMVNHCKYPPVGHRSVYGSMPQLDFAPHPLGEMATLINDSTLLVLMIETPQAVVNADAIAATPGVDALLVGTSDLTTEMGIPGEYEHPDLVEAYETVIAACQRHGKYAGLGGVYAPDLMARYINMGMQLIICGSDLAFLMAGARNQADAINSLV